MREILTELTQQPEITGALIATVDGMTVAADLDPSFDEDTVAAFTSSLLLSLKKSLSALGAEANMSSCTVTAAQGKINLVDMDNSYLVVMAARDSRLETTMPHMTQAVYKIKNRRVA